MQGAACATATAAARCLRGMRGTGLGTVAAGSRRPTSAGPVALHTGGPTGRAVRAVVEKRAGGTGTGALETGVGRWRRTGHPLVPLQVVLQAWGTRPLLQALGPQSCFQASQGSEGWRLACGTLPPPSHGQHHPQHPPLLHFTCESFNSVHWGCQVFGALCVLCSASPCSSVHLTSHAKLQPMPRGNHAPRTLHYTTRCGAQLRSMHIDTTAPPAHHRAWANSASNTSSETCTEAR